MDGVTVLNEVVREVPSVIGLILAILCLASLGMGLITTMIADRISEKVLQISLVLSVVVAILSGACLSTIDCGVTTNRTYEVTLDDSVSMTEFLENYELIEQRGKIYVVKERDKND